jgi:hypothetical protein
MAEQADEDLLIVTLPVLRSSAAFSEWTIGLMQDSWSSCRTRCQPPNGLVASRSGLVDMVSSTTIL